MKPKILGLSMLVLAGVFTFSACSCNKKTEKNEEQNTRVAEEESNKTYTLSYDKKYEIIFDSLEDDIVDSGKENNSLPKVNDNYIDKFIGWFKKDSNVQVTAASEISENMLLEARFEEELSGLYDDNKYVKTWEDLANEYPGAFDNNKINNINNTESYFAELSGKLVIDSSITAIDGYAFYECKELTEVITPTSVLEIGDLAFYNCNKLTTITIPQGISKIPAGAFFDCKGLRTVVIAKSVSSIGGQSFANCKNFEVYYLGNVTEWESVTKEKNNTDLLNATIYYYSEVEPSSEGNYWHYGTNGEIVIW